MRAAWAYKERSGCLVNLGRARILDISMHIQPAGERFPRPVFNAGDLPVRINVAPSHRPNTE